MGFDEEEHVFARHLVAVGISINQLQISNRVLAGGARPSMRLNNEQKLLLTIAIMLAVAIVVAALVLRSSL